MERNWKEEGGEKGNGEIRPNVVPLFSDRCNFSHAWTSRRNEILTK